VYRRLLHRLPGVGHEVELGPDHVAIVAALDALSQQLRDVVALYYFGDLPVAEVAQTLGIPEGTVKTRLAKARAELAELLTDEEHDRA
jgi:RNA polymerase sigma-70 factor (ECF subfamily)